MKLLTVAITMTYVQPPLEKKIFSELGSEIELA